MRRIAEVMMDPEVKEGILRIAAEYDDLAERAEERRKKP